MRNGRNVQDEVEKDRPQVPSRREKRHALQNAIAVEEARLSELEAQQAESKNRLSALRAELAAADTEPQIRVRLSPTPDVPTPRTAADKIALFRSLFRGRIDVFPTRFVSKNREERICTGVPKQVRQGRM